MIEPLLLRFVDAHYDGCIVKSSEPSWRKDTTNHERLQLSSINISNL